MRSITLLFALVICISAFGQSKKQSKGLLPKELAKQVWFGMDYKDFEKLGKKVTVTYESFRTVYLEEVNSGAIKHIVYYFTTDGSEKLYEVIIEYYNADTRDKVATKLFGKPNHDGTEWRITRKKSSFKIMAWTFMEKLVVVGVLPNCEWEGEE